MKEKLAKLRADLREQKTDISDMETKPKGLTKFLLEKSQEDHQELQLLIESIQESVRPLGLLLEAMHLDTCSPRL